MTTTIDLTDTHGHDATLTPKETPEVQLARLKNEAADNTLRRWREAILFGVTLAVVLALLLGCAGLSFNLFGLGTNATPDDRKWAMSALTLGLGGMIGYLVRGGGK